MSDRRHYVVEKVDAATAFAPTGVGWAVVKVKPSGVRSVVGWYRTKKDATAAAATRNEAVQ